MSMPGHSTRWRQRRFLLTPYAVPWSEKRGEEGQWVYDVTSKQPETIEGERGAYCGIGWEDETNAQ